MSYVTLRRLHIEISLRSGGTISLDISGMRLLQADLDEIALLTGLIRVMQEYTERERAQPVVEGG